MKLSYKGLSQKQIEEALENAIPQKPRRVELGGDIYYKCHRSRTNGDRVNFNFNTFKDNLIG